MFFKFSFKVYFKAKKEMHIKTVKVPSQQKAWAMITTEITSPSKTVLSALSNSLPMFTLE